MFCYSENDLPAVTADNKKDMDDKSEEHSELHREFSGNLLT